MGFFNLMSKAKAKNIKQDIINRFYSDYAETPFISDNRPKDWIDRASLMPKQCLVERSMMKRYADGLLPGHVYMLYWLGKYTNKKTPSYFEYKYGIDFDKEKAFLYEQGLLNDTDKPSEAGEKAIKRHYKVIEKHTPPKPDQSVEGIGKQIQALRDNIRKNKFTHYEFVTNSSCCEICAALNGKHFPIRDLKMGVNAPPMHEGCRCSITAWVDRKEYEEWLNNL